MIRLSWVTFTFEEREVPQKWDICKVIRFRFSLQSLWVNATPFIHMAPLKCVPYPVCPSLMGSFSDPHIHLVGILSGYPRPALLLDHRRGWPFFGQLSTAPSGHSIKPGIPPAAGKRWGYRGTAPLINASY